MVSDHTKVFIVNAFKIEPNIDFSETFCVFSVQIICRFLSITIRSAITIRSKQELNTNKIQGLPF